MIALIVCGAVLLLVVLYGLGVWRELRYAAQLILWHNAERPLVTDLYLAAGGLTLRLPLLDLKNGPGDTFIHVNHVPGQPDIETMVNFKTLAELVKATQAQLTAQGVVQTELKKTIEAIRWFENQNRQPKAPTYFGKRLWVPFLGTLDQFSIPEVNIHEVIVDGSVVPT